MSDPKLEEYKRLERIYKNHPDKKRILRQAQRRIFRKDMLQPIDPEFKETYKRAQKARDMTDYFIDIERQKEKAELEKRYLEKNNRRVKTLQQKTLEDLHKDHPKLVTEEAILKWQT